MKTLTNEAQQILTFLKQEAERKKPYVREMLKHDRQMWLDKMGLIEEIEAGYLTTEKEINQILELIELVAFFNSKTDVYGTEHSIRCDKYLNVLIESTYENELRSNTIYFKEDEVYLNDEEYPFPSLSILLNEIELRMFGIHDEEYCEDEAILNQSI